MSKNKEKKDFWDELTQSQKEEIEQGIKEVNESRIITWGNYMKELENYK